MAPQYHHCYPIRISESHGGIEYDYCLREGGRGSAFYTASALIKTQVQNGIDTKRMHFALNGTK